MIFAILMSFDLPQSQAKLRTKFPNWSFDTVTALQRAMLENLYRDLIEEVLL